MKFWDLSFCDCCYIRICLLYSPRMWRWSSFWGFHLLRCRVFSTYVEVILFRASILVILVGILHVCGGDPSDDVYNRSTVEYSPRMWRWSWWKEQSNWWKLVFSTHVKVLLYWDSWRNHECNYTRPQGKILKSQASKKQKEIFR